jgi:peptidoglycan/xylan/chitin deacetylase (PgdA/CDA1 family)
MGTVVLSVDAELGWGFHDQAEPPVDRLANAHRGWRTLIDLCDTYHLNATWAVVGHLLLDDCDGRHSDHPTPDDWFDHERGPNCQSRGLRFGNGLIDELQNATIAHDIGLHTFSHVEFGAEETTREIARAEVATGLELARERGIEMRSFVFPRNNVGHLDVLAAYGIDCYRGVNPADARNDVWEGSLGKLARATVSDRPPQLVDPYVDSFGLVNVPASLHLFSFEGLPRRLVEQVFDDPIVRQAKLGIDAALERDGVFHMWLHPNSLTEQRDIDRVREIFEYLDEQRGSDALTVKTMAEVANDCRTEADTVPTHPVEGT